MKRYGTRSCLLLISLLILVVGASGATVCSICGKSITEKYYVSAKNQIICGECVAKYPPCSGCGLVSKSLVDVDGVKFCRDCYMKLSRCSICDKPITGGYKNYPEIGIKVCLNCEKSSLRCENCGRPVKALIKVGDANLCEQCAGRAPRCVSCGTAILRDYTYYEGNDSLKYCTGCAKKYPPCADCGAPSGPRSTRLDDGRLLCPICLESALFESSRVTPVKKTVLSFLNDNLGMNLTHQINYSMQGKDFLDAKSSRSHGDLNGLFYRKGDDYNIYVLYGLRKKDLVWVLSHELSHAWQAENTSGKLELEDLEGFAQWVGYNALKYFGYETFAATLTAGNTVYSRGLNKMLSLEKTGGARAVFAYIRSK